MTTTTRVIGCAAMVMLLVTGAGCSDGSDDASTSTTTQAAGEGGARGGFDLSDGKIQVSDGEGGNYEVDAEGDADLPDGFPSDLEVPGTTKVLLANSTSADGKDLVSITVELDGSVGDAFTAYEAQLTNAGYAIESDSSATVDGKDNANVVASKGDQSVVAIFATGTGGVSTATVSIQPQS